MKSMPDTVKRRWSRALQWMLSVVALGMAPTGECSGQTTEFFAVAKQLAYDANYRNDQPMMLDAIARFDRFAADSQYAASALYFAAWTRWMLAASRVVDSQPTSALQALDDARANLDGALRLRPDDAESHALMAWVLMSLANLDRTRWASISVHLSEHRRRAVELAPANPRVLTMDATMTFYAPAAAGGGQEAGIAKWIVALRAFDKETVREATAPDWGGALVYGWLANLYLSMSPPRVSEATQMAQKAIALRPDYWWVRTHVVPRLR